MNMASDKPLLPGISRAIRDINARILDFARRPNDAVFLTGEPGTERALAARLIHQLGDRRDSPFARIIANWKLPPDFTDQIQKAAGGTVFVSLVREFPVDMQYTLLELALDRTFTDAMSGDPIEADVRLILTTTLDLETLFERSPLLPDLREMMVRAHVDIPALRDRREDIPALVRFALQRARESGQSEAETVNRQVLALFRTYSWPGNAEQLLLVAAQAALKTVGPIVTLADLPEDFVNQIPASIVRKVRSIDPGRLGAALRARDEELSHDEEEEPAPEEDFAPEEQLEEALEEEPEIELVIQEIDDFEAETRELMARLAERAGDSASAAGAHAPSAAAQDPAGADGVGEAGSAGVAAGASMSGETDAPADHRATPSGPWRDAAGVCPPTPEQEILTVASRLYVQSALLARQMQGPLPPGKETAKEIAAARGMAARSNPAVEEELARGLEQILTLRRQLAILNQREQNSALTIRDLLQRLEMAADTSETADTSDTADAQSLAAHLSEIDAIIDRITDRLPKISEDIQHSIRRLLGKKRRPS